MRTPSPRKKQLRVCYIKFKKMKAIRNINAQVLSKSQMKSVSGGETKEEYCARLNMWFEHQKLVQTWTDQQWASATDAWNMRCV